MGLSKKPSEDKKPISRDKLAKLLAQPKKPKIKAELPSLAQVPSAKPTIKAPIAIEPARAEGTAVAVKFAPGYTPSEVFDRTLDNTVGMMAENMGVKTPEKGSYEYNVIKDDILKNKPLLATTQNEEGKPVFGLKSSGAETFMKGLNDFTNEKDKGINYAFSDKSNNINSLEDVYKKRFTTSLPKIDNPILYTLGQMSTPLAQGITGAVTGMGLAGPYGAAAGFLGGALSTFALSAPDGVAVRYSTTLEDAYLRAREEGFTKDEAYEKANSVAKAAAGGEVGMQAIYSMFGAPATAAIPKAKIINEGAKKGLAQAASKFVKKSYEFVKPGAFLGTEAALATGISEAQAAKEGLNTEDAVEKAISTGSDFAVLDMAIRGALGIVKIPGYLKAQVDNVLQTADRNVVREFTKQGEADGIYPAGSINKLSTKINNFETSKQQSPKYPGDETREAVVAGLTQKLNGLIDEQSKLADVHKADLQGQIDNVKKQIEIAKTAKNPLEAELNDDGSPVILTDKNKQYAITEARGQVEEIIPESGIAEREGVISEQQKEAGVQKAANETGDSNRLVSGTEQVEPISFADRFRKLKIDEALLTGGDKGVAQTNIVGLPIAIYNASIEAIAKGIEAGGVLADLIEQQVKGLKEGGYKLDENKYRKSVGLMGKLSNDKGRLMAESEMSGIKSSDYTSLQRFALEKYNEASGIYKDPEMLAKALRDELNKKMDTSAISDEVFEMIGYDAVINESKAPFVPKPATKATMETLGYEPEAIVTKPKDVFKAMYTAATNVGKSVEERVLGAANMVAEYIKKKDKLTVAPKDIAKAIGRLVTSKMDSETASEVFAENLSDIIENAKDANQIAANKATIKKIKKDANSPTYGTIATKETTDSIDFIAPSKIKDSVNPENVSEVTVLASEKRRKYQELLDDYRNSITGNPTKSRTARLDLIDFIDAERKNFEAFKERQLADKRLKSGAKYDKLVAENKIDEATVSREEFIDADINPTKAVSDEVDEAVSATEVDKVEAYKQVVDGKRKDLRGELDNGDIDPMDIDDVEFLLNAPLDKISPRNLKLMSNIIEDILNGERPSRIGDIKSDIQATDGINRLLSSVKGIRDIAKAKYSGAARKLRQMFDAAYKGDEGAYDELSITNMIRALNLNEEAEKIFRSTILGAFEKGIKEVNSLSKTYTENLYKIFAKDSVVIDGQKVDLKGEPILTEKNSQKIGIIAALLNFENPLNTINAIIESTKMLKELKDRSYDRMVKERILALKELGVIEFEAKTLEEIQAIRPLDRFDLQSALSTLNKRERIALDFIIKENKKIAPQLNKVTRNYYGESLDTSNDNYVGMTAFKTDVIENVNEELEEPLFGYNQINKMRASSTMQRNKQMVMPTRESGKAIHYDFDIFRTQPKKYHESLAHIMTTEERRRMAKMFARKEFQDFMKGKFNIEPTLLKDNMRVFKNIMTEYVNGERKPYVVTREIEKQRNAISRFFYGKLLNSMSAGVKQYVPNLPSMIAESPESFFKAMEISTSYFNKEKNEALIKFLRSTSQANRVTGGFEALTKSAQSIADSDLARVGTNLYQKVDSAAGLSLEFGDRLTTIQSLLTGYIKALIKQGKIKNAAEFDIVAEMERGLDQDALSSAENFLSFMNNESSTYAKAKIFRKDGARWLRMLQSFSHNATTNFLVDLGRFNDEMANTSDRTEALKRMTQYLLSTGGYGVLTYYMGEFQAKMGRDALKYMGVIEDSEDLEKAIVQDKEKTMDLLKNGVIFDAILSRQIQPVSELVKGLADLAYYNNRKGKIKEAEETGVDISNTTLSEEYSPFYESKYMGTVGSYYQDMERLIKGLGKGDDNVEYKNLLTPNQREAQRNIRFLQAIGMATPSKDIKKIASAANKALRQGKVTQLEKDAQNYIVANGTERDYKKFQIDDAKKYIDEQRSLSKSKQEFDKYLESTVKDFAENKIVRQELIAKAKQYGDAFSRDVVNIKSSSPNRKIIILNNRFPDMDISQPITKFMLENKVITPEDYAMSLLFDKKGNPKNEANTRILMTAAKDRYIDAASYLGTIKSGESLSGSPMTAGPTDEEVAKMINKMMAERYMRGKVIE